MFVLLTTSERPSLQAFWKRACLSSWGRSLKPVYLIYREKNNTHIHVHKAEFDLASALNGTDLYSVSCNLKISDRNLDF